MSGTKQRRRRPGPSRSRAPRHVEPTLDPNWQSPYVPSNEERQANREAVRAASWRRQRPLIIAAAVVLVASLALFAVQWLLALAGIVVAGGIAALAASRLRFYEARIPELADRLRTSFAEAGSSTERLRLATIVDRLAATFGLTDVTSVIIRDDAYNAALLPGEGSMTLLVTSALVRDFELIETEGVVAHLMARQRLGLIEREAAAAVSGLSDAEAHRLAGVAQAYRADEVAAAAIRYPLGLSRALRRCAEHRAPEGSFFASDGFRRTRWVWFDVLSDRPSSIDGDVDDAEVRSRALAEW